MTQTYPDNRSNPAAQYGPEFVRRWDELIDWDRRKAGEQGFFVDRLRRSGARRVLDAAAGTGFHSVLLAESGFEVTTLDCSEDMLRVAAANGRARGHEMRTVRADWRELATAVDGKFDAIVCLGSSFPHLFDEADRRSVLEEFHAKLEPGGVLIVDHRNFDSIRRHEYRSSGNYYYCGSGVSVSVDHIDERLCRFRYGFGDHEVFHLEVYPVLQEELRNLLADAGFSTVDTFGDFKPVYNLVRPDFIIHVARKPAVNTAGDLSVTTGGGARQ